MKIARVLTVTFEELKAELRDLIRDEIRLLPKKRIKPYSGKEVDELFGIKPPTRYNWISKGHLERIEIEGTVRYTVKSVEDLLDAKR